ncbi:hypothetical protein [Paraburkholderia adhaesiva]|uniref:hypothetical protein n=1 Tax=Paraburkholderia adhaesiva TaxID=2883244 RepID=UPI001F286D45|nr:hypothetical protein [Paraburkholderia adhaesiva]
MRLTDSPPPVTVPFAQNGNRNTIPVASQTGMTKGAASFNDGFPPLTMTDPLKGGIPPFGVDMNGILFVLSQAVRWLMAGGPLVYDATFANDPNIGGYPAGVVLLRANGQGLWLNLRDDNTIDPDAADITNDGSASGWVLLNADWNATGGPAQILNRPNLAKVATSGQYGDLTGTPPAPANADWDATSGLAQILHRPNLAKVATSGSYDDLTDVPEIPAAQINADWDAASGPARILNRPDLAAVATTGQYSDLTGEPVFTTPPQFDVSTAAATSAFVQRALGSYAGQVTYGEDTGLNATDAGMAIQWAGPDGGTLTLAPTSTLPLSAIAFLIYNHGAGVLNLVAQGSDFIWMGGPTAVAEVVLQPGEFAVCLARVNGEYDVLVTRIPVDYTLPAATATTLGGVIAGQGLSVAPDGTLSVGATSTTIINLSGAANVALDLTPLAHGAPEILFNLPVAASTSTTLSITNPPAAGVLAEFVLVVHNSASSAITWPSTIKWPQGIAPSLSGAAGKLDTFIIYTQDGGATYCGFVAGQDQ